MPTASMRFGAVLSAALLTMLFPGVGVASTPAPCTPASRDEAVSEISLDETGVKADQQVHAYFQGQLPEDACAGDTVVIGVPAALRVQTGTFTIADPEGVPIGTMAVSSTRRTAVLTFNDYVGTRDEVRFYGYLSTTVSTSLAPSSRHDLRWAVGARSFSTPVTTRACPRCDRPRTRIRKRATLEGNVVSFALESRPTRRRGEKVLFIDRVAPGQQVRCRALRAHRAHVGRWGQLVYDGRLRLRVTACGRDSARRGGTLIRARVTSRAPRQHLVLAGSAVVTNPNLAGYADVGVVVQRGRRVAAAATATRSPSGSGVGGTGRLPASPPPPTTPRTGSRSAGPGPEAGSRDRTDGSAGGVDRMPILLSGAATFLLGALMVTLGLRRRS